MFENNYKCVIIVLCTCGGMVDAADSKADALFKNQTCIKFKIG